MTPERLSMIAAGIKPVRKKPVQVQAAEITYNNIELLLRWIHDCGGEAEISDTLVPLALCVKTHEDWRIGCVGDYLIRGTEGEFYPIKAQVYLNVYEDVVQHEC